MARIRTLKPEFWSDEKLGPLEPLTRLVFLGLISLADDAGRLVDSVRQLNGLLFPYTDDSCGEALETLARLSRIARYTSASGQRIIQIVGWSSHQRVDKPSKHVLPGPAPESQQVQALTEPSRDPRETLATHSGDPRAPTLDLGPRTLDRGATHARETWGDLEWRSIKGLYGWPPASIEGTDQRVWAGTNGIDRVACMEIAASRLEGEGKAYQGKLYRRTLVDVIAEQRHEHSGKPDLSHWEET